jgi:hypothetical protein
MDAGHKGSGRDRLNIIINPGEFKSILWWSIRVAHTQCKLYTRYMRPPVQRIQSFTGLPTSIFYHH